MKQIFRITTYSLFIALTLGSTNALGMKSLFEESKQQVLYTPSTHQRSQQMPPASSTLTPQEMEHPVPTQTWQTMDVEGEMGESKEAIKVNNHSNDPLFKLLYNMLITMPRELIHLILDYTGGFEGKHVRTISEGLFLVSDLITLSPHIIGAHTHCSKVILFDLETGKQLKTINGNNHTPIRLSENELASCSYANDVSIVNWQTGATKTIRIDKDFHEGVAKLPHGPLMTYNHDSKTIKLWDHNTGKLVKKMNVALDGYYEAIPISEHIIATKEPSRITFWDIHTGKRIKTITLNSSPEKLIPLSATIIAIANEKTIAIYDIAASRLICTIKPQGKLIDVTKFPTGNIIVAAIGNKGKMTIALYDPETGTCLKSFETGFHYNDYLIPFLEHKLTCPSDTCIVALGEGQKSGKKEIKIWN